VSAEPVRLETAAAPWTARRRRAEELHGQHPFAAEVLTLYLALLDVHEEAWEVVRSSSPRSDELAAWAAARILPGVVEATAAAGPATLADAVGSRLSAGAGRAALAGWLEGAELDPVDRYLARASLAPALEALGDEAGAACARLYAGEEDALCPACGGPPQVSYVADSGEPLVSGRRSLLCARCCSSWEYTRSACPACGETSEAQLLVYAERWEGPVGANGNDDGAEQAVFPHLRVAACGTCRRYLIEVDMGRDGRAVPEVDELAALPLDLYAADQGLKKVTPNLMGF
jgi:hypothetical protein